MTVFGVCFQSLLHCHRARNLTGGHAAHSVAHDKNVTVQVIPEAVFVICAFAAHIREAGGLDLQTPPADWVALRQTRAVAHG